MADLAESLLDWLLPGIIIVFLALYVVSIRSGLEPEMALVHAGGAGAVLAVLGRLAVAVVSVERRTPVPIDVMANSTLTQGPDDDAVQVGAEAQADSQPGEQQHEAVGA
jgi:hypothetical protein